MPKALIGYDVIRAISSSSSSSSSCRSISVTADRVVFASLPREARGTIYLRGLLDDLVSEDDFYAQSIFEM